jgi:hypothetical protein
MEKKLGEVVYACHTSYRGKQTVVLESLSKQQDPIFALK